MQAHLITVSHPSFLAISSLSAFFSPLFGLHLVIFHASVTAVLLPSSLIYRDRNNPLYPIYASLVFGLSICHLTTVPAPFQPCSLNQVPKHESDVSHIDVFLNSVNPAMGSVFLIVSNRKMK